MFHFCEKWGLNFSTPKIRVFPYFFRDSSTATATETVIPTIGLLPAPRKPIISMCFCSVLLAILICLY